MTISLPSIWLNDIDHEKLISFAEKHGDHYIVGISKDETRKADVMMTVIRVLEAETPLHFGKVTDEDGDMYAVYQPDVWHDGLSYSDFIAIMTPYLRELDTHIVPVQISQTKIFEY